jgi:hypothetical protein
MSSDPETNKKDLVDLYSPEGTHGVWCVPEPPFLHSGWVRVAVPDDFFRGTKSAATLYAHRLRVKNPRVTYEVRVMDASLPGLPLDVKGAPMISDPQAPPPPPKFNIATVVEVSIIGTFPAFKYPGLQSAVEAFEANLREIFIRVGGENAHTRRVDVRPATKEEVLHFTPRKIHYSENGLHWICGTAHVALCNLSNDVSRVTCKLCRQVLTFKAAL